MPQRYMRTPRAVDTAKYVVAATAPPCATTQDREGLGRPCGTTTTAPRACEPRGRSLMQAACAAPGIWRQPALAKPKERAPCGHCGPSPRLVASAPREGECDAPPLAIIAPAGEPPAEFAPLVSQVVPDSVDIGRDLVDPWPDSADASAPNMLPNLTDIGPCLCQCGRNRAMSVECAAWLTERFGEQKRSVARGGPSMADIAPCALGASGGGTSEGSL